MVIREAKAGDAASIGKVVVDTWRSTYAGIVPQEFLDSLTHEKATVVWHSRIVETDKWPGWFTYVAENDGKVIGFAGGGPSEGYNLPFAGELGFIYLLKAYQRQGIGRQLAITVALRLEHQGHNSMLVWVFSANPYKVFYECLGGRAVAERSVTRYGGSLAETAYGWENLRVFGEMRTSGSTR